MLFEKIIFYYEIYRRQEKLLDRIQINPNKEVGLKAVL